MLFAGRGRISLAPLGLRSRVPGGGLPLRCAVELLFPSVGNGSPCTRVSKLPSTTLTKEINGVQPWIWLPRRKFPTTASSSYIKRSPHSKMLNKKNLETDITTGDDASIREGGNLFSVASIDELLGDSLGGDYRKADPLHPFILLFVRLRPFGFGQGRSPL